ncbi:MAG: TIM barrel protein, partial [Spirochaetaceae bacterium]|nr:TIM barrel protein [Spirochaetaceae bacterium]
MKENFAHGLELTHKAGYGGVEFAGYFGLSPEKIKELLAQHQLKAVSTHVGITRLREALDEEFDYAVQLGYSLIICPMLPCKTKAQTVEDAEFLETCAQRAAKKGLVIGYHNHAHEFAQFDGKYAQDILLETAPSIKFEPDVFWIAYAGVDPVEYLQP